MGREHRLDADVIQEASNSACFNVRQVVFLRFSDTAGSDETVAFGLELLLQISCRLPDPLPKLPDLHRVAAGPKRHFQTR